MRFVFDDGGREAAGFKGRAGDCVARAVAIASQRPYAEVYAALSQGMGTQRKTKRSRDRGYSARNGVTTKRKWFKDYMRSLGFVWTPTMRVGQGCKVHLSSDELPSGRLVVAVSRHYTAMIDGELHDTFDPQRFEIAHAESDRQDLRSSRCVYGYWQLA